MNYFLIKTKAKKEQALIKHIEERNLPVTESILNKDIPGYMVIQTDTIIDFGGKGSFVTKLPMNNKDVLLFREDKIITKKYNIGDMYTIKEGPFQEMKGQIVECSSNKIKVSLSIFGRPTSVELSV